MKKNKIIAKTKFGQKLSRIIAFFSSFIGKIVFFLIAALLVGLLVYIIVRVIMKDVAKLLNLDGAAQSTNEEYEFLKDLTQSGYDAMLNSKDLVDYYAFEYAVLMDAARFMEETGTIPFVVEDVASIDLEELGARADSREIWAMLAASALCGQINGTNNQGFYDSTLASLGIDLGAGQHRKSPPFVNTENFYKNGFIDTTKFSTEHSKEDLFYYPVYNEHTKETALYPYLELSRVFDKVTYYVQIIQNPEESYKMLMQGDEYTLGDVDHSTKDPSELDLIDLIAQQSRFEFGTNVNYQGLETAYNTILNNLEPCKISTRLNSLNVGAYDSRDASYNSSTDTEIDLYANYPKSLYYGTGSTPSSYRISLETLLDRFLPNAVLLSSWRLLKNDGESADVSEDVVDEIKKIYSEACLTDEDSSGEKLLVKDVFEVSMNINEKTNASDLLKDVVILQDSAKEKYLYGGKTSVLYNSYEAQFDSRIWGNSVSSPAQNGAGGPTQRFEGGFSGDVLDDIKLALTHYSENYNVGITQYTFDQVLKDAARVIKPTETIPMSKDDPNTKKTGGQYILYTPLVNGKYLVNCTAIQNSDINGMREHYELGHNEDTSVIFDAAGNIIKNHKNNSSPYNASDEIKECMVPFIKVAYTQKDGFRTTAVIIYNNSKYMGYVIKGKEIVDYSKISNKNTFAYFETRDIKSTTARHWVFALDGEKSDERWVVEDAFEGLSVSANSTVTVSATYEYMLSGDLYDFKVYQTYTWEMLQDKGIELDSMILEGLAGKKLTEEEMNDIIFNAGSTAIVRTPVDPSSRDYTDLLDLPTDASISTNSIPGGSGTYDSSYGGGSSSKVGGETIITDKAYFNLKELGYDENTPINIDTSQINGKISRSYMVQGTLKKLALDDAYRRINNLPSTYKVSSKERDSILKGDFEFSVLGYSANIGKLDLEYSVVMPTTRLIIPIKQEIWDNTLRFYLVGGAKTWSGIKHFNNEITTMGEFVNRDNILYIVSGNKFCKGIHDYTCTKTIDWRGKLFAPIFAGNDDANTTTRETDVQLLLSEWLDASENGMRAADYYIRDLYALINYSKGIKDDAGNYIVEPIKKPDGTPYINEGSYTYLYIPDEILQFDETSAEKAFWEDRLINTHDPIDPAVEGELRSQAKTFTWQIVDYDLYEECQNDNGTANVYPLWMFGNQMSRTLYAIAANSSHQEHYNTLFLWGGYASGFHKASDLYSRNQATKIYYDVFENGGNAKIKAKYQGGRVILTNTDSTVGENGMFGYNEDEVKLDETGGSGLYVPEKIKMDLGGIEYTFNGPAAAAYGYELYRQTLILKSGEKAEAYLKAALEDEILWSEIRAVAPGIVTNVKGDARGGFAVYIQHSENVSTSYLHMKRFPLVQIGQYVGAGTLLGYEGTTGSSGTYHVHITMYINGKGMNPVHYMYPFFTPFFYEEKAEEAGYALDSDYMSTERTVFPYGQIVGSDLKLPLDEDGDPGAFVSGDNFSSALGEPYGNGQQIVKIKNYVPYMTFMNNSADLLDENSGYMYYIDYSKLPKAKNDLDTVDYTGEILKTNPDYFDEEFRKAVMENGYKIEGVDLILNAQ
ncbi:MAG: M23 family metallopeptidase [Clostridia bacterium]|nr:M23 family metallopeptidase [Clostridia bacterium]